MGALAAAVAVGIRAGITLVSGRKAGIRCLTPRQAPKVPENFNGHLSQPRNPADHWGWQEE